MIWGATAVAVALIVSIGAVLTARALSTGSRPTGAPRPVPATSGTPIDVRKAAESLESNPTRAKLYAENAVGNCLQNAWANAGYHNVFDQYAGDGIVQFSTGTPANPTGSTQARTLISVRVYADGTISSNSALDHWGCSPFKYNPRGGNTVRPENVPTPQGLEKDGPLDVGCTLHGDPGYANFDGIVTLYNPGASAQNVANFLLEWGSNGILLSENEFSGPWSVPSGQDIKLSASAPMSATSCQLAGFNP